MQNLKNFQNFKQKLTSRHGYIGTNTSHGDCMSWCLVWESSWQCSFTSNIGCFDFLDDCTKNYIINNLFGNTSFLDQTTEKVKLTINRIFKIRKLILKPTEGHFWPNHGAWAWHSWFQTSKMESGQHLSKQCSFDLDEPVKLWFLSLLHTSLEGMLRCFELQQLKNKRKNFKC